MQTIAKVKSIMGQAPSLDKIQIGGFCEKQFESVKKHFIKMLTKGEEENVQLCVYVDGNCVVDLYGTAVGDKEYNQEKLQVCLNLRFIMHYKFLLTIYSHRLFATIIGQ